MCHRWATNGEGKTMFDANSLAGIIEFEPTVGHRCHPSGDEPFEIECKKGWKSSSLRRNHIRGLYDACLFFSLRGTSNVRPMDAPGMS